MRVRWILLLGLAAMLGLLACNKQKPKSLDYTEKLETGEYSAHGLPGEGHVGSSPADKKYSGYEEGTPSDEKKQDKPEKEPEDSEKPPAP